MIKNLNFTESSINKSVFNTEAQKFSTYDTSIFDENSQINNYGSVEENALFLEEQLKSIQDENGAILDGWDKFKCALNIGKNSEDCEEYIEKYKKGEISFEEALEGINTFKTKQDSSLNLFANITTSIVAIGAVAAATFLTGGTALPLLATIGIGAAAGGVTKAAFKLSDRATNEVKGDAANAKEIAKDALSGAVTGGIAAATAGTGANTFKNGYKVAGHELKRTAACMAKCTRTGFITGAVSGSSNYVIDTAFDDEQKFHLDNFVENTVESSIVGATVGCIMGGVNGGLRSSGILNATDSNVAANSACTASYKVTNDRIRNIAA